MDCPDCKQEFDESAHIPRILTACGHTLCEFCMKARFNKKSVTCPQCTISTNTGNLTSLPTNLALIQLKQKKKSIELCEKHKKPIEAFCCNHKILVCVLCLVEDGHKSHELTTIQKASRKYRDNLSNYSVLAINHQEVIQKEIQDLNDQREALLSTYSRLVSHFSVVFEIIKKIVAEKEASIKETVKKILEEETEILDNKHKGFLNILQNIEQFKQEVSNSTAENDIEFIGKYQKREDLGKTVTNKNANLPKIDPFLQLSPETEVKSVLKLIQDKFFIKTDMKLTPQVQKKKLQSVTKEIFPKAKVGVKASNKTIPKPVPSLDWDNISAISHAHSDDDTLSMKSFDFNILNSGLNS